MRKLFVLLLSLLFLHTFGANLQQSDTSAILEKLQKTSIRIADQPEQGAIDAFDALQKSTEIHFNRGIDASLTMLGNLYASYNLYPEAISYYEELLKSENSEERFIALNELAKIYLKQQDYPNALKYYFKKIDYCKAINDTNCLASEYFNIGVCFYQRKDLDEASKYLNLSIRMFEARQQRSLLAMAYDYLGKTLLEKKNFQLAREYFEKSLYTYQEIGAKFSESQECIHLAEMFQQNEKYKMSIDYAQMALDIAENENLPDLQISAHNLLAECYYAQKKFELSVRHYLRYQELNEIYQATLAKSETSDSEIRNRLARQNQVMNLTYSYEHQLAEKQDNLDKANLFFLITAISLFGLSLFAGIAYFIKRRNCNHLQKAKTKEIQTLKTQITHMDMTRDKIFDIISHDLKNPFNALLGFSSLMVNEYDEFNDLEKKKFIRQIYEATDSITKLLNNLLEWGKSQSGNIKVKKEPVSLAKVVGNLMPIIIPQTKNKNIFVKSNIEPATVVYADPNMISTVLRNLVTNAVKFTPVNGEITLDCKEQGKEVEVCVKDTGIGIPEKYINTLFTGVNGYRPKLKSNQGTGLGLILCREFVTKNGGKIWVESTEGKGSSFKFTLPVGINK